MGRDARAENAPSPKGRLPRPVATIAWVAIAVSVIGSSYFFLHALFVRTSTDWPALWGNLRLSPNAIATAMLLFRRMRLIVLMNLAAWLGALAASLVLLQWCRPWARRLLAVCLVLAVPWLLTPLIEGLAVVVLIVTSGSRGAATIPGSMDQLLGAVASAGVVAVLIWLNVRLLSPDADG